MSAGFAFQATLRFLDSQALSTERIDDSFSREFSWSRFGDFRLDFSNPNEVSTWSSDLPNLNPIILFTNLLDGQAIHFQTNGIEFEMPSAFRLRFIPNLPLMFWW